MLKKYIINMDFTIHKDSFFFLNITVTKSLVLLRSESGALKRW